MADSTQLNELNSTVINSQIGSVLDPIGQMVAEHYLVEAHMNTISGEADLYSCKDTTTGQACVLKLYKRKEAIKPQILESIKKINHPNIAKILATGALEGYSFVILPFYANGSMQQLVEGGSKLTKEELAKSVIAPLNNAINVLHQQGILHKDLKPSNIMLDKEGNPVIIDFGISSATGNNQTFVITKTGATPQYLAPEAFREVYTKDTDYYAFGITLFELHTGFTPYKNQQLSPEEITRLSALENIPFPENFDADLKDLILGLTYKDLTYSKDLSNPNRRWGYNEVQKWLKGEKQIIPGAVKSPKNKDEFEVPYKFKGKIYRSNSELIKALLLDWNDGKKEIGRGFLTRHYDVNDLKAQKDLCAKGEDKIGDDKYYLALMYQLAPELKELYWQGECYENIVKYGEILVKEANEENPNIKILKTATELLQNDILRLYIKEKQDQSKEEYLQLESNHKKLLSTETLNYVYIALRLGMDLSGLECFSISGMKLQSLDEFDKWLDQQYEEDCLAYYNYFDENTDVIDNLEKTFTGKKAQEFKKILDKRKRLIILANQKYYFKNWQELFSYMDSICNTEQVPEFFSFWNECGADIEKQAVTKENKNQVKVYKNKINEIFRVDEYCFRNKQAYNAFIDKLELSSPTIYENFLKIHFNS